MSAQVDLTAENPRTTTTTAAIHRKFHDEFQSDEKFDTLLKIPLGESTTQKATTEIQRKRIICTTTVPEKRKQKVAKYANSTAQFDVHGKSRETVRSEKINVEITGRNEEAVTRNLASRDPDAE
jgi:hypothetical protein